MLRQLAQVEYNMISVGCAVYYARGLEDGPPHEIPEAKPVGPWLSEGKL
jgi:hypothetical protein